MKYLASKQKANGKMQPAFLMRKTTAVAATAAAVAGQLSLVDNSLWGGKEEVYSKRETDWLGWNQTQPSPQSLEKVGERERENRQTEPSCIIDNASRSVCEWARQSNSSKLCRGDSESRALNRVLSPQHSPAQVNKRDDRTENMMVVVLSSTQLVCVCLAIKECMIEK